MKSLVLETGGSIDRFCEKEKAVSSIRDDELLVRVHSVALNPSDYQTAEHVQGNKLDLVYLNGRITCSDTRAGLWQIKTEENCILSVCAESTGTIPCGIIHFKNAFRSGTKAVN